MASVYDLQTDRLVELLSKTESMIHKLIHEDKDEVIMREFAPGTSAVPKSKIYHLNLLKDGLKLLLW